MARLKKWKKICANAFLNWECVRRQVKIQKICFTAVKNNVLKRKYAFYFINIFQYFIYKCIINLFTVEIPITQLEIVYYANYLTYRKKCSLAINVKDLYVQLQHCEFNPYPAGIQSE